MAQASGPATQQLITGEFLHKPSGVHYRVFQVIEAQSGHLGEAMALWEEVFERAPERSAIGLNLARGFCVSAQFDKARACVARVLEFNPDSAEARQLEKHLNASPPACGMH